MHEPFITRETEAEPIDVVDAPGRLWTFEDFYRGEPIPDEIRKGLDIFQSMIVGLALSAFLVAMLVQLTRPLWSH